MKKLTLALTALLMTTGLVTTVLADDATTTTSTKKSHKKKTDTTATDAMSSTSTSTTSHHKKTTDTTATKTTAAPADKMSGAPAADTKMAGMKMTTATKTTAAKAVTPTVSASDIAAAKASGQVWVNTDTKVYHASSSKYYGATKKGKFMSAADAEKAGYRAAKGE